MRTVFPKRAGCTRAEITDITGIQRGGSLSTALSALIASNFIVKYVPFGCSKRKPYYKLIDPLCIFFLKFVEQKDSLSRDFWLINIQSQNIISWRGLAFENVCFNHIEQIKKALGINGVSTRQSAWSKRDGNEYSDDFVNVIDTDALFE